MANAITKHGQKFVTDNAKYNPQRIVMCNSIEKKRANFNTFMISGVALFLLLTLPSHYNKPNFVLT